ncbi:MAG: PKD domain-containing protein [Thermoplasmata archaeon]|nr:PKD domain-containing protein [Thermoplasmata archaeon]
MSGSTNSLLNDTWLFHAGRWSELCSGTSAAPECVASPPAEEYGAMAYDPATSDLVLIEGIALSGDDRTWTLHGGNWTNMTDRTQGNRPGGGGPGDSMAYDPAASAIILIDTSGETWSFSNDTWTQLGATPNNAVGSALFYDSAAGGLILWGGQLPFDGVSSQTWKFQSGNWTRLLPAMHPPAGVPWGWEYDPEFEYGIVFEPVFFGYNSTWVFLNDNWTNGSSRLGPAPPRAPNSHDWNYYELAYDSSDGYGVAIAEIGFPSNTSQTWILRASLILNVTASAAVRDLGQTLNYSVRIQGGIGPYAVSYRTLPPGCVPPSAASSNFTFSCLINATGYYSLTANVTDRLGTVLGVVLPLLVNADPVTYAYADQNPTDVGLPCLLMGMAAFGTGALNQSWTVGGGPPQAGSILRVNFTSAGIIDAVFTVVDRAGFRVNTTVVVAVNAYPTGEILPSRNVTDVGLSLNFSANQTGGSVYVTEGWVFGDGSASSGLTASHAFGTAGVFTVGLWTNDSIGASSFTSLPIRVNPSLIAGASANASQPLVGSPVEFTSVVAGGTGPDTYWWSFGDGSTSNSPNATHAYSATGAYKATLVVNDSVGGSHSTRLPIDVISPGVMRIAPPNVTLNSRYTATDLTLAIGAAVLVGVALGVLIGRARRPPGPPSR